MLPPVDPRPPVDYSPLSGTVSSAEVAAFRASVRGRPEYSRSSALVAGIVVIVVIVILGFFFLGFLGLVSSLIVGSSPSVGASLGGLVVPVLLLGAFLVVAVVAVRAVARGGTWQRWLRLSRFAAANGMEFSPVNSAPQYPGAIFGIGRDRAAIEHLRSASGRFLDYGNYRYTTGSGKNQTTRTWGFLALQLDRALPHMVLDAKANNALFGTNLPAAFAKNQVLHLEGDFDSHFTLYCPQQYERDALYVFTPDLMALLIDSAAAFDVEIVDTWMFVYSTTAFDLGQPAVHARLLGIVDTVGAKALRQTARYADERVGDPAVNLVAPQGRRLSRRVSVGAIIVLAVFVAFWVWSLGAGIIGSFLR